MLQAGPLNNSFFLFSLLCNLLVLGSSFHFKESKIFFISALILAFKLGLFYAPFIQVKIFSALFLPFFFTLFVFLRDEKRIFAPINSLKFILLAFIVLVCFIEVNSPSFYAVASKAIFKEHFFHPLSEAGFVFFLISMVFLLIFAMKNLNFAYVLTLALLYLPLMFKQLNFELASIWLFIYLLYRQYMFAFTDFKTKLPNAKSLARFCKASKYKYLALFKLDDLSNLNEKELKALQDITISFLRRVLENKLFLYKEGIYASAFMDANQAKQSLEMIKEFLNKHSFRLGNKDHKTSVSIAFVYIKEDFELSLESARKCLLKAQNEGGGQIIYQKASRI